MCAIVDIDGIVGEVQRSTAVGESAVPAMKLVVHSKTSTTPLSAIVGAEYFLKPYRGASGRYALVYAKDPTIMGSKREFQTLPGDAMALYAIRVPTSFRLVQGESFRAFCFRALAEHWAQLTAPQLQETLDRMPLPGPEDWPARKEEYAPDSKAIAELAESLEPCRRVVILRSLAEAGQVAVYPALAESVWQARNFPEMALIELPWSLNPPTTKRLFTSSVLLECAESTEVDAVRALYVRSVPMDGTVDYKRLAKLLRSSGPLTQHEAVLGISNHRQDSEWKYGELSPAAQKAKLQTFVSHWLSVYGV